jgi:hypothetical protein
MILNDVFQFMQQDTRMPIFGEINYRVRGYLFRVKEPVPPRNMLAVSRVDRGSKHDLIDFDLGVVVGNAIDHISRYALPLPFSLSEEVGLVLSDDAPTD